MPLVTLDGINPPGTKPFEYDFQDTTIDDFTVARDRRQPGHRRERPDHARRLRDPVTALIR